jgi:hypothetical protein
MTEYILKFSQAIHVPFRNVTEVWMIVHFYLNPVTHVFVHVCCITRATRTFTDSMPFGTREAQPASFPKRHDSYNGADS